MENPGERSLKPGDTVLPDLFVKRKLGSRIRKDADGFDSQRESG